MGLVPPPREASEREHPDGVHALFGGLRPRVVARRQRMPAALHRRRDHAECAHDPILAGRPYFFLAALPLRPPLPQPPPGGLVPRSLADFDGFLGGMCAPYLAAGTVAAISTA